MTLRFIALVGLVLLSAVSTSVDASEPEDEYTEHDILRAANARPLTDMGPDAIQFSSEPALGGTGYVIEITRRDDKWAVGKFQVLAGHPYMGWTRVLFGYVEMRESKFTSLIRDVDNLISKGEPGHIMPNGDILVCTDGPGYSAEIRRNGHRRKLSGFCGDSHPNEKIASLMRNIIRKFAERWTSTLP